jgi:hypothetical protein
MTTRKGDESVIRRTMNKHRLSTIAVTRLQGGAQPMKNSTSKRTKLLYFSAVIITIGWVLSASQSAADTTTPQEVKEKVTDAAEAIRNYSVDQRAEAVKKAKAVLDDLDTRIDRMESQLNQKWDHMDQVARRKATASLTALRKQRTEAAEWYGGLEHSSRHAWEDVKTGFIRSFQELRRAFDKAQSEF